MKLPYFKWYPADAEIDGRYRAMSFAERGFYLSCLNLAWSNGGVPADPAERALQLGCTPVEEGKLWPRVSPCFEPSAADPSRLVNPRQEKERLSAISKSKKATDAVRTRYERTTQESENVAPRAYDSNYVSDVVVDSKKETTLPDLTVTPGQVVQMSARGGLLDDFSQFREAAEAAQLPASEPDFTDAKFAWGQLDFQAKLEAVKGLKDRIAAGEYQDANFRPLPQNYIKKRMWQRPIRASPKPKTVSVLDLQREEAMRDVERRLSE